MITVWILIANYIVDRGPGSVVIQDLPSYEECRRVDAELRGKMPKIVAINNSFDVNYRERIWTDSLCLEARKQK